MIQDFSKRIVIVVNKDLPSWQVLNTVAHISAYLGNKLGADFGTGEYFTTLDAVNLPRNSQYPIIVFGATQSEVQSFAGVVRATDLTQIGFIREMLDHTNDEEIEAILKQRNAADIEYLGMGVFGPNDVVKAMTKKYSLWK